MPPCPPLLCATCRLIRDRCCPSSGIIAGALALAAIVTTFVATLSCLLSVPSSDASDTVGFCAGFGDPANSSQAALMEAFRILAMLSVINSIPTYIVILLPCFIESAGGPSAGDRKKSCCSCCSSWLVAALLCSVQGLMTLAIILIGLASSGACYDALEPDKDVVCTVLDSHVYRCIAASGLWWTASLLLLVHHFCRRDHHPTSPAEIMMTKQSNKAKRPLSNERDDSSKSIDDMVPPDFDCTNTMRRSASNIPALGFFVNAGDDQEVSSTGSYSESSGSLYDDVPLEASNAQQEKSGEIV